MKLAVWSFLLLGLQGADDKNDWPLWRRDPARRARSPLSLPDPLRLQWVRTLPPLIPAYRNPRLQFDRGYEPVVAGKTLFVGSSRDDTVTAYDTETGREKWRFTTDGPVRFAPAAWRDRLFVGSDDGRLYCLDAQRGTPVWTFRAVPSDRKVLGDGRLISVWPIRGGPVVADNRVYFAAGIWPSEGVFLYALDAATGEVVWLNDRTGHLYGTQPHAAEAIGGVTPQGYLVVNGDDLVVPCGSALPATFDRKTGALKDFSLPRAGRLPGGWYVAAESDGSTRLSKVKLDQDVTRDRHEDRVWVGPGEPGLRSQVFTATRTFHYGEGLEGVKGTIHSMLAADGKLFVVTEEGGLYCFGAKATDLVTHATEAAPLQRPAGFRPDPDLQGTRGYGLVWGIGDGAVVESLIARTELHVVAVDPDAEKVRALRARFQAAGLYGSRVAAHVGDPARHGWPPYLASVIVCADPTVTPDLLFPPLRPFGGAAAVALPADRREAFTLAGARVRHEGRWTWLVREGPLPGSADYTGGWTQNRDDLVRAPLGVLWFDDDLGLFKRSPQPVFVDGIMVSRPKNWRGSARPYTLLPAQYSDVYTGRRLREDDPWVAGKTFPIVEETERQPEQYRPPTQKDAWNPAPPVAGERMNPLTGAREPRRFPKSYGCDGGVDYGHLYTQRSGTPAFYDKRVESGTIHVSGPRSGCTNSLIPANGVLNVPYFYEGCTCSYPLPVGLALVRMPDTYEQWATWGDGAAAGIRRIGLNLGAPGDRMTEAGTLWLDYPIVGGPSPAIAVETEPEKPEYYYRHSLWVSGGQGWPWVAASGVRGLRKLTLSGLREDATFTVRLTFADPEFAEAGRRVFNVRLQGRDVWTRLDVARESGGRMRSLVKEVAGIKTTGSITVELVSEVGQTVLSGVELVAEGLALDPMPKLEDRSTQVLFRP